MTKNIRDIYFSSFLEVTRTYIKFSGSRMAFKHLLYIYAHCSVQSVEAYQKKNRLQLHLTERKKVLIEQN
jgi:hypothetical protein